jgi:hypothetical protein
LELLKKDFSLDHKSLGLIDCIVENCILISKEQYPMALFELPLLILQLLKKKNLNIPKEYISLRRMNNDSQFWYTYIAQKISISPLIIQKPARIQTPLSLGLKHFRDYFHKEFINAKKITIQDRTD